MKTLIHIFGLAIVVLIAMTSCTKEDFDGVHNIEHYSIKSEVFDGKTTSMFIYNSIGKIAEKEGRYNYSRYSYDNYDRLIKVESAMDPSAFSCLYIEKTELMTSLNSTITNHRIFEYDQEGKLIEVKNYFKKDGDFVYISMNSLEYEGDFIVIRNLHNEEGTITQFYTYEYDNNGNVERRRYYSYLFTESSEPRIISENSYKYDNKRNPFMIFKALGNPGLYTNTNNVIETNSILYEDTPGVDKHSTSKTTYEYNLSNYPIKVISENSEYEYRY